MLKRLVIVIALCIFVVGIAAGCEDSQIIMRLYQQSNSHASLWDGPADYNIISNPGFESGTGTSADFWRIFVPNPGNEGYRTSNFKFSGNFSMQFEMPKSIYPGGWGQGFIHDAVSVMPGTQYILSAMIYNNLTRGNAYVDLNDVPFECENRSQKQNNWQKTQCTFTTSNSATVVYPRVVVDGPDLPLNTGNVWFDDISIVPSSSVLADNPYNYQICYNQIFGKDYDGANPHNCTSTNKVIWLNSAFNSHASSAQSSYYSVPVCYGNLICSKRTNCNSEEREVVRLYQDTNSHVSAATDLNYPIKICCGSANAVSSEAYWADLNGDSIEKTPTNVTVMMVVNDSGSGNLVYSIEKKDGNNWYFVTNVSRVSQPNTKNSQQWAAYPGGIYRFKAYVPFNGVVVSDELNVSGTRNSTIPVVNMTRPLCGEDFDVNESFETVIRISDPYDIISATVNFGDGTVMPLTNGISTIIHKFATGGTKQIIIEANDSEGGSSIKYNIRRMANIIAIDNSADNRYIAACIEKPENGEVFDQSTVDFLANTTRAFFFNATSKQKTMYSLDTIRFIWRFTDVGNTFETATFLGNTYTLTNAAGASQTFTDPMMRGYRLTKVFPQAGFNRGILTVEFV